MLHWSDIFYYYDDQCIVSPSTCTKNITKKFNEHIVLQNIRLSITLCKKVMRHVHRRKAVEMLKICDDIRDDIQ